MCLAAFSNFFPIRRFADALSIVALVFAISGSARASDFDPPSVFLRQFRLDCHTGPDSEDRLDVNGLNRELSQPASMRRGHELLFGDLPVREIEPANPRMKKQKW